MAFRTYIYIHGHSGIFSDWAIMEFDIIFLIYLLQNVCTIIWYNIEFFRGSQSVEKCG